MPPKKKTSAVPRTPAPSGTARRKGRRHSEVEALVIPDDNVEMKDGPPEGSMLKNGLRRSRRIAVQEGGEASVPPTPTRGVSPEDERASKKGRKVRQTNTSRTTQVAEEPETQPAASASPPPSRTPPRLIPPINITTPGGTHNPEPEQEEPDGSQLRDTGATSETDNTSDDQADAPQDEVLFEWDSDGASAEGSLEDFPGIDLEIDALQVGQGKYRFDVYNSLIR